MAKGRTPCDTAQWFLPHNGSLSGIPEHHGRNGEHKAGLVKCMQLPMQLHEGRSELAVQHWLQRAPGHSSVSPRSGPGFQGLILTALEQTSMLKKRLWQLSAGRV